MRTWESTAIDSFFLLLLLLFICYLERANQVSSFKAVFFIIYSFFSNIYLFLF